MRPTDRPTERPSGGPSVRPCLDEASMNYLSKPAGTGARGPSPQRRRRVESSPYSTRRRARVARRRINIIAAICVMRSSVIHLLVDVTWRRIPACLLCLRSCDVTHATRRISRRTHRRSSIHRKALTQGRTDHFSTNSSTNSQFVFVSCARLVPPSGDSECMRHFVTCIRSRKRNIFHPETLKFVPRP